MISWFTNSQCAWCAWCFS